MGTFGEGTIATVFLPLLFSVVRALFAFSREEHSDGTAEPVLPSSLIFFVLGTAQGQRTDLYLQQAFLLDLFPSAASTWFHKHSSLNGAHFRSQSHLHQRPSIYHANIKVLVGLCFSGTQGESIFLLLGEVGGIFPPEKL